MRGKTNSVGGVTILAPLNVASLLAEDASRLYAKTLANLLGLMLHDNILTLDLKDEVLAAIVVTHNGKRMNAPALELPKTTISNILFANFGDTKAQKQGKVAGALKPTAAARGTPILDADHATRVYVIKRGIGKGYVEIVNALFYKDSCNMVYGHAQTVLTQMIEAVRGVGKAAV